MFVHHSALQHLLQPKSMWLHYYLNLDLNPGTEPNLNVCGLVIRLNWNPWTATLQLHCRHLVLINCSRLSTANNHIVIRPVLSFVCLLCLVFRTDLHPPVSLLPDLCLRDWNTMPRLQWITIGLWSQVTASSGRSLEGSLAGRNANHFRYH